MTDTHRLEMEIRKSGFTKKEVAKLLNLSEQGFLLKLQNKTEFKASEIEKLCTLLHLQTKELFFCPNSELNSL